MTKEEALIRGIIGPTRYEIRVFACAVSVTSHLLFCEGVAQDDILVVNHIYAEVAHQLDSKRSIDSPSSNHRYSWRVRFLTSEESLGH